MKDDKDITQIDNSIKNAPLTNFIKGTARLFNICSEMLENDESCRLYEGEVNKQINANETIKGSYKLGIKVGDINSNEYSSKHHKSKKPTIEITPKTEIINYNDKICIRYEFNDILNESVKFSHVKSLFLEIKGAEDYSEVFDFNKENYRLEEVEIKYPYLIVTLSPL